MRSADDLMGVEPASPELISAVSIKRDVVIAQPDENPNVPLIIKNGVQPIGIK